MIYVFWKKEGSTAEIKKLVFFDALTRIFDALGKIFDAVHNQKKSQDMLHPGSL